MGEARRDLGHSARTVLLGERPGGGVQFGGVGLNASVGARFLIRSFIGVGAEYRFTAARGSFALAGDQYSATELTHHLLLGVTLSSAVF